MYTISQLIRKGRCKHKRKRGLGILEGAPQMRGICNNVGITKPRKPNSAERKTANVTLSSGRKAKVFIPGEKHNLAEHCVVLVNGGKSKDLSGVRLHVVRGTRDASGVKDRRNGRSRYGTKKQAKS